MDNENQQSLVAWSDLQKDLLHLMMNRLRAEDCFTLLRVCPNWSAAAAEQLKGRMNFPLFVSFKCSACHAPHHLLESPLDGSLYTLNPFEELDENYHYLGSSHGWSLVLLVNSFFLINPFTGARIILPLWHSAMRVRLFTLSSAPTDPNCIVTLFPHSFSGLEGFIFCRIGDVEWTQQEFGSDEDVFDLLAFGGKLYFLTSRGSPTTAITEDLGIEFLRLPSRPHEADLVDKIIVPYLVESEGNVLLVLNAFQVYTGDTFVVFRLDLSTLSWVRMETIGNRVLFIGHSCSVSLPAAEQGYKENHIYFIEHDEDSSWWIFNMEDGTFEQGEHFPMCEHGPSSIWIIPSYV